MDSSENSSKQVYIFSHSQVSFVNKAIIFYKDSIKKHYEGWTLPPHTSQVSEPGNVLFALFSVELL